VDPLPTTLALICAFWFSGGTSANVQLKQQREASTYFWFGVVYAKLVRWRSALWLYFPAIPYCYGSTPTLLR